MARVRGTARQFTADGSFPSGVDFACEEHGVELTTAWAWDGPDPDHFLVEVEQDDGGFSVAFASLPGSTRSCDVGVIDTGSGDIAWNVRVTAKRADGSTIDSASSGDATCPRS